MNIQGFLYNCWEECQIFRSWNSQAKRARDSRMLKQKNSCSYFLLRYMFLIFFFLFKFACQVNRIQIIRRTCFSFYRILLVHLCARRWLIHLQSTRKVILHSRRWIVFWISNVRWWCPLRYVSWVAVKPSYLVRQTDVNGCTWRQRAYLPPKAHEWHDYNELIQSGAFRCFLAYW